MILIVIATLLFVASVVMSIARKKDRSAATLLSVLGIAASLGAVIWHSMARGSWLPLGDNYDALLWLALMIASGSLYLQSRRAVGRLDWVSSPIVILLLVAALVFGSTLPHTYTRSMWAWTHRVSVFAGPVAFALAASAGVMYLVLSSRLRGKHLPDARFGSLERLERITHSAVRVGFVLLTIGIVTGTIWAIRSDNEPGASWLWQPKVLLAGAAYVLYALVLHSPINPAFRGRRTAVLSIAGFVLLLATIVVVQRMG